MFIGISIDDLMEYTEWERGKMHHTLRKHGSPTLAISAGTNGDGRFENVGDIVRHIFSAETRYVDRLSGRAVTDTASIPNDDIEALFKFGRQSRDGLKAFVAKFPEASWDVPTEFQMMKLSVTATPRKIVTHVLMHEIRHWPQIATLLRLNGVVCDFRDFLFSPVMGGEIKRITDATQAAG